MEDRTAYRLIVTIMLIHLLYAGVVQADSELRRFLEALDVQVIYPGADRLGDPAGKPLVAPAFKQGESVNDRGSSGH